MTVFSLSLLTWVTASSPEAIAPAHVVPMNKLEITAAKPPAETPLSFPFFQKRNTEPQDRGSKWKKLFDGQRWSLSKEQQERRANGASSLFSFLKRERDPASDQMLVSRCRGLLYTDSELAGSSISITAENGQVILSGTVANASLRERAERLASRTQDVDSVDNRLKIEGNVPQWFRHNAVTLAPPQETKVRRITQAPQPEPPAVPDYDVSDAPRVTIGTPKLLARGIRHQSRDVEHPSGPQVVLGQPQFIRPAPDLPVVKTYAVAVSPSDAGSAVANQTQAQQGMPQWQPAVRSFTVVSVDSDKQNAQVTQDSAVQPAAGFEPQQVQTFRPTEYETREQPVNATRPDIDAVFRSDWRARGLRYRLSGPTLQVFGQATTPTEFYAFVDRVMQLPGVQHLSFGNDFRFAP